jgi:hypothetical protein
LETGPKGRAYIQQLAGQLFELYRQQCNETYSAKPGE